MEHIKELIDGTKFENDIDEILSQFTSQYPNNKLEDLKHICSYPNAYYPRITFSLDEKMICCSVNEDDVWINIAKLILTSDECHQVCNQISGCYYKNNQEMPTLRPHKENISYELYPFEQGYEFLLPELGFHEPNFTYCGNASKESKTSIRDLLVEEKVDLSLFGLTNISFCVERSGDVQSYVIYDNDVEIGGFDSYCYSFQPGDGDTNVYLYDNDNSIIIENCGDVSSLVVIKFHNKK